MHSPNSYTEVLTPLPQNVRVYGNCFFKEVIKLKKGGGLWNLKNGMNELICRTETESQTLTYGYRRGQVGGGVDWRFGIGICTRRYMEL